MDDFFSDFLAARLWDAFFFSRPPPNHPRRPYPSTGLCMAGMVERAHPGNHSGCVQRCLVRLLVPVSSPYSPYRRSYGPIAKNLIIA